MKHMKKASGSIVALSAAFITKSIIQNIGVENISVSTQVALLIFGFLIAIVISFIVFKNIPKHFMIFLILLSNYGIILAVMIILKKSYSQYFHLLRTPFIVITILFALVMFIVLLLGLRAEDKRN